MHQINTCCFYGGSCDRTDSSKGQITGPLIFFLFFEIKYFWMLLLFKCSFLPLPPTPYHLNHPHLPPVSTRPRFCPCVLYSCSCKPFTLFPPLSPSHLPAGYCQLVLNFNVFGHLLLACLFCCFFLIKCNSKPGTLPVILWC